MNIDNYVVVTKDTHPSLFEMLETISHDRGSGAGHTNYAIPKEFSHDLDLIDHTIAALPLKEWEIFAIGELSEALAIADRSPDLTLTHAFLDAFFNDFEENL